jgi:cysteinyl-tRNA synthetase
VLAHTPAEAVRLLLLRTHYRGELDFSDDALVESRKELDRFYRALDRTPAEIGAVPASVMDALCDDLNTPLALSAMHALADAAMAGDSAASAGLRAAGHLLGLLQNPHWFRGEGEDSEDIQRLVDARIAARRSRNWAEADRLRVELDGMGVALEDRPDGSTDWLRAKRGT